MKCCPSWKDAGHERGSPMCNGWKTVRTDDCRPKRWATRLQQCVAGNLCARCEDRTALRYVRSGYLRFYKRNSNSFKTPPRLPRLPLFLFFPRLGLAIAISAGQKRCRCDGRREVCAELISRFAFGGRANAHFLGGEIKPQSIHQANR
jgi:hypothetical protein